MPITAENEAFLDKPVHLDGSVFKNSSFEGCDLIYSGGKHPKFEGCSFTDCTFKFSGAASNTVGFLRMLYQMEFEGVLEYLNNVIKAPPKNDSSSAGADQGES